MKRNIHSAARLLALLMCAAMILSGCGGRREEASESRKETRVTVPKASESRQEDKMVLIREEYVGVYDYTVEYTYNAEGLCVQKTEREDEITEYSYYPDGTLKQEVLRIYNDSFNGNIRWSIDYRPDGTLEKRVDNAYGSDGMHTGEEVILYDEMGNPLSSTWKVYNKVINSESTVMGSTWTTTYENTYDEEGRMTGCFQMNDSTMEMTEETWWYGDNGEVTHRLDKIQGGRLSYRETTVTNADGNLLSYVWESSDGYPKHKAEHCLYDAQGNLIFRECSESDIYGTASMGTISGSITHYTNVYSQEGLLTQTLKSVDSYYYNGVEMETSTVPSHTSVLYTYDSEGRCVSATYKDVHGNEFYTDTWTYDDQGNLTCREDIEVGTVAYTYALLSEVAQ